MCARINLIISGLSCEPSPPPPQFSGPMDSPKHAHPARMPLGTLKDQFGSVHLSAGNTMNVFPRFAFFALPFFVAASAYLLGNARHQLIRLWSALLLGSRTS